MKRIATFAMFIMAMATNCQAQNEKNGAADSIDFPSLDEIIETEANLSSKNENERHYKRVWGKTTFLNLNYSMSTFSSDAFPSASSPYQCEYKNKLGLGLLSGNTYNFHKKPIGTVLFIGLDYVPFDLNLNLYDEEEASPQYTQGEKEPYSLPWHKKKMTLDYGMSVGPSLTFYPFTAIHCNPTDHIRLQFYYRVGYHIGAGMIEKVSTSRDKNEKAEFLWANGMSTSYGANLTWGFVGVGFEKRQFSKFLYHPISSDYKTGDVECEQTNERVYIQFRF